MYTNLVDIFQKRIKNLSNKNIETKKVIIGRKSPNYEQNFQISKVGKEKFNIFEHENNNFLLNKLLENTT